MTASIRPFRVLLVDPVYGRHTPFWSAPLALGYIAATLDDHFGKACQLELVRDRDAPALRRSDDRRDRRVPRRVHVHGGEGLASGPRVAPA